MPERIHVVGGGGGIGRWLVDRVFAVADKVYCYDTNVKALESLPAGVTGCPLTPERGLAGHTANFAPGDIVLLVVPLPALEGTIADLLPLVKPGSLVATLSSIQEEPISLLARSVKKDVSFCGCHPLFGPTVSSPVGQLVALTEFDELHPKHRALRDLLESRGLIVSWLSAAEHDRYMAYVQALAHFVLLGFAATLGKAGVQPSEILKLRTPNFQFLYAFASRVLKLSTTTTGAIQTTQDAAKIRESVIATLIEMNEAFRQAGTAQECAEVIERLRSPLTGADVDEGAEIATLAADSLQDFEEVLYRYRNTGAPFVFRQRSTGELRAVKISAIRHDSIMFEETKKAVERDGRLLHVVALDDTARENYAAIGLQIRKPEKVTMRKRNIKLLDRQELDRFYNEQILPIEVNRSFLNPHRFDEDYCEEWLPMVVAGLKQVRFLESHRNRGEIERITLRLIFNPCFASADITEHVRLVVEEKRLINVGTKPRVPALGA